MLLLSAPEPIPTDMWGVVVPTWIAAAGGLVGATIAVVALIVSLRAKGTADEAKSSESITRDAVDTVGRVQADTIDAALRDSPRAVTLNTEDIDIAVRNRARLAAMLRRIEKS